MAADRRRPLTGQRGFAAAALLSIVALAGPAAAQERVESDSLPRVGPDTTPPDTAAVDTARADPRRVQRFPPSLVEPAGEAHLLFECDRACLLGNPWTNLAELLSDLVPGLTMVRSGYFGGPHHLAVGAFGPGFLTLIVDGRRLSPLESGQPDLLRISLVATDRVRAYRTADGVVVSVDSRRHDEREAYSRIEGATGQPGAELLRMLFLNGFGRSAVVSGFLDLTDIQAGRRSNRLDFQGRLSWMPASNRNGIELEYENESLTREASDTLDVDRREVTLRARRRFSDAWQAELVAGTEALTTEEADLQDVAHASASLAYAAGDTDGEVAIGVRDGAAYPSVQLRGRAGFRPDPFSVTVSTEGGVWDEFSTLSASVAAAFRTRLLLPITLRAEGATGTRGVTRPLEDRADSVSFDVLAGGVEVDAGPFDLRGRVEWQSLGRILPFGAAFDREVEPAPGAEITALEVVASGPVLPIGALVSGLEPIRGSGFWRRHDGASESPVPYVPEELLGGRLTFRDAFFSGNLEVTGSGALSYRSRTPALRPGDTEPVLLPGYTWWSGHLGFRIGDFRVFWRYVNPAGLAAGEVPGVTFPVQVNLFGIRWSFVN